MRIPRTKKLVITATVLVLLVPIGFGLSYATRLIDIGVAYKAKMLCSEVFVAGRDPNTVLADLILDDLAPLSIIDTSIIGVKNTVTASFFGLFENKVRFRNAFGCALASDALTPASWEKSTLEKQNNANYSPPINKQYTGWFQSNQANNPHLVAVLNDAFSEPDPDHPRRTRAIVILQKGRIVAEQYARGIEPDTPLLGWSMTKSVMNALVGVLVREGQLALDTPILADAWRETGDPRRHIKLEHLLHMSSGLEFNEDMSDPLADVSHMILRERDMAAFAADKSLETEPGSRWQYSSGTTNILSGFLRRTLGEEAYHQLPRKALFDPLGMTKAMLEADTTGTFVGSSYMYATAREWARFGQLYLQDGIWEGKRILPEGWVKYTRTPAPANLQKAYGAHFWLRIPKEYRGIESAELEGAFHAIGHEAQFVTVVPSHSTVIVRLGKTRYSKAWEHDVFVNNVLTALSEVR